MRTVFASVAFLVAMVAFVFVPAANLTAQDDNPFNENENETNPFDENEREMKTALRKRSRVPQRAKPQRRPSTQSPEARIRSSLNKTVDLVFDGELFGDVCQRLRDDFKINIVIDVNLDGVMNEDTEVSANLTGLRLGDGLRLMLRPVDATYTVRDGVLLIISVDDEGEPDYLSRHMIDVSELLQLIKKHEPDRIGVTQEPQAHTIAETPEQMLTSIIMSIVNSDSWEQNGSGAGVVQCVGGVLVLSTSESVADDVRELIQDLTQQLKSRPATPSR